MRNLYGTSLIVLASLGLLWLGSCGGSGQAVNPPAGFQANPGPLDNPLAQTSWPTGLPERDAEPWEELNDAGYVVPRGLSGINGLSEFQPGVQRYDEGGDVIDLDEASHFASGAPGNGQLSFAIYELQLAGETPGAMSVDANLMLMSNGVLSGYYIGVSNYDLGVWEWHGPFTDSHVRLSLPDANYISTIGNFYVTVAAYDGANIDVVGVGANKRNWEAVPPPAPSAMSATPKPHAVYLEWTAVAAADLAGYQLFWSTSSFSDPSDPGVTPLPYLIGGMDHLLTEPTAGVPHFFAVSAVDFDGNLSPLSTVVPATPQDSEELPIIELTTDTVSGVHGIIADMYASGADLYDWDLNGDGVWEVTGDTTGLQLIDTNSPGIIRPRVRGITGLAENYGSISLFITNNARPVASAYATPASGPAPHTANFGSTAIDFDGNIAKYLWDFDSDQTWDYIATTEATRNPPPHVFNTPGTYNVKFRVNDDLGAWDVDTVTVVVGDAIPPLNMSPNAQYGVDTLTGTVPASLIFYPSFSSDLDGIIVKYEWDWNGDSIFEEVAYNDNAIYHTFIKKGWVAPLLRVTDDGGATGSFWLGLSVSGPSPQDGGGPHRTRFEYASGPTTATIDRNRDISAFNTWSSPVIATDGTIYLLDSVGELFCLYPDLATRWSVSLSAGAFCGPVIGNDGLVYVTDNASITRCWSPDGTEQWSRDVGNTVDSTPLLVPDENRLYFTCNDSSLYCLDSRTGVPIWDNPYTTVANASASSPTLGPDGMVIFGDGNGLLYMVGRDGLDYFSPYDTGISSPITTPTYDPLNDAIVFCVFQDGSTQGSVHKLDANTGTLDWSRTPGVPGSQIDAPAAIGPNGEVIVGTWDNKVYALNGINGNTLTGWPFTTGNDIDSCAPVVDADGYVYVGSWDMKVYCLKLSDGTKLWESTAATNFYNASLALGPGGQLYALDYSGLLRVFSDF